MSSICFRSSRVKVEMFGVFILRESLKRSSFVRQAQPAVRGTTRRSFASSSSSRRQLNEPLSGAKFPRVGGISTMMRLPNQTDTTGLDACFVGVPLDIGTSYRSGTRLGPRQIRYESFVLGPCNYTGAAPFESLQVADIGDVTLNLYDLKKSCEMIREQYATIVANGCKPLTLGGDHTLTYPILQAIKEKYGPVGLVHIDAHDDVADTMFGEKVAHGTPFRRAAEEGCLDPKRVIQIGLRGSNYSPPNDLYEYQKEMGFHVVPAHRCWHKSMEPLMEKVRNMMGDGPVYLSFDIDSIDPGLAPGTGTPEIAGLTTVQALEIVRGCKGLNLVGADLVERWSHELAGLAQRWANRCDFGFNFRSLETEFSSVGQNIAQVYAGTLDSIMDSWNNEKADYDFETNTCSGFCVHYTLEITRRLIMTSKPTPVPDSVSTTL